MELLSKNKERIEALSAFMRAFNETEDGKERKKLYERYKDHIQSVTPVDLFYVEQYREDTPLDVKTIKAQANKFVNLFSAGLKKHEMTSHEHPFFQALLEENEAILSHLRSMKPYFKKDADPNVEEVRKDFEKCLEFEKKFVKKENILFPNMEKGVPSTKPLEVMWALHDDARTLIKKILNKLGTISLKNQTMKEIIGDYYYLIYGLTQKEQMILFPVADKALDEKTLDAMYEEAFEYGFTFLEKTPPETKEPEEDFEDGFFKTKTGALSFKQLTLLMNHLPVDITYVDKNDRVRYFNDRAERHFPRSPSIIGRLVKHCHPPKSVDMVEKIVEAFKNGQKDTAEFWITFKGRFLHIRYFAVRDEEGNYEGVLEASQDVTDIRELQGEKRLLDWE